MPHWLASVSFTRTKKTRIHIALQFICPTFFLRLWHKVILMSLTDRLCNLTRMQQAIYSPAIPVIIIFSAVAPTNLSRSIQVKKDLLKLLTRIWNIVNQSGSGWIHRLNTSDYSRLNFTNGKLGFKFYVNPIQLPQKW